MTANTPNPRPESRRDGAQSNPGTGMFAKAVREGIDNEFIKWAEEFWSEDYVKKVSTSQIRNIYGTVKKLEMGSKLDLPAVLLLKPRIAYAHKRKDLGALAEAITKAIDAVNAGANDQEKLERFQRFCKGFEAILAYHRAAGGK